MASEKSTDMNSGTLDADIGKSDANQGSQAVKWIAWGIGIFAVFVIAIVVLIMFMSGKKTTTPPPPPSPVTTTGTSQPGLTNEEQLRKALPAPKLGHFMINDSEETYIKVEAGWNIMFVPAGKKALAYAHYIDERLVCEYGADGTWKGDNQPNNPEDRMEGWKLKPGQGISSKDGVYIKYMGTPPPIETWYPLALALPIQPVEVEE